MKKMLIAIALMLMVPLGAKAATSALAVDVQPVSGDVGISSGSNTMKVLSDGSINVNVPGLSVTGSTVQVTGLGGGPVAVQQQGSMTVTPGTGTWNADVSISTVGIRGSQGKIISSSDTAAGGTALQVINVGRPNLDGKSMVYASSNSMVTSGVLSLTGLGKSIDLQAFSGVCTFTINSGAQLEVSKNTSESYDYDYTLTNPSVTLVSKDTQAICKVRIVGAN